MNKEEFLVKIKKRIDKEGICYNFGIYCKNCRQFIHKNCNGGVVTFLKLYYEKEMNIKKNLERW